MFLNPKGEKLFIKIVRNIFLFREKITLKSCTLKNTTQAKLLMPFYSVAIYFLVLYVFLNYINSKMYMATPAIPHLYTLLFLPTVLYS